LEDKLLESLEKCPLCNSDNINPLMEAPAWRIEAQEYFSIQKCLSCGVGFTSPRPTELQIGKYYSFENYDSHNASKKGMFSVVYQWAQRSMFAYKKRVLNDYLGRYILDYGAGNGAWVSQLIKSGKDAIGFEISAYARLQANKTFHIELQEPEEIFKLQGESVDSITGFHVFEHVYNPKELTDQFFRVLKTGGFLMIAVPNNKSFDAKYYGSNWAAKDVPIHTLHFNDASIQSFFESMGFTLESKKALPLDSFYVSILSERIKKGNLFRGFLMGFVSFLISIFNNNWSSKIYVFRKK